jgi:hypothetical protein
MCELLEEVLRFDTSYNFDCLYWIKQGKAQWIADGCPEFPFTEESIKQPVKSIYVIGTIGKISYNRKVLVSKKYTGDEEYTRRYHTIQ